MIRRRGHDQTMHLLHAPAAGNELGRQPVEQFRMTGRLASQAEVVWRVDQTTTETLLPHAVDDDSRCERIVW